MERDGKRIYDDYYAIEPAEEAKAVAAKHWPGTYRWQAEKCVYEYRDDESEVLNVVLVD